MSRRRSGAAIVILSALGLAVAVISAQQDTQPARTAVDAWLKLIDSESYGASWESAASGFKKAITQDRWSAAVSAVRGAGRTLKSRELKSAMPATNPPGAPPGEYVIFQFGAVFEKIPGATEQVTAIRDGDGEWRVAGYFVKSVRRAVGSLRSLR